MNDICKFLEIYYWESIIDESVIKTFLIVKSIFIDYKANKYDLSVRTLSCHYLLHGQNKNWLLFPQINFIF